MREYRRREFGTEAEKAAYILGYNAGKERHARTVNHLTEEREQLLSRVHELEMILSDTGN